MISRSGTPLHTCVPHPFTCNRQNSTQMLPACFLAVPLLTEWEKLWRRYQQLFLYVNDKSLKMKNIQNSLSGNPEDYRLRHPVMPHDWQCRWSCRKWCTLESHMISCKDAPPRSGLGGLKDGAGCCGRDTSGGRGGGENAVGWRLFKLGCGCGRGHERNQNAHQDSDCGCCRYALPMSLHIAPKMHLLTLESFRIAIRLVELCQST